MTLTSFVNRYRGQRVAYMGLYKGQCLSLVKRYITECHQIPAPPSGSGSAKGYWYNYSSFPLQFKKKFAKVPYKRGKVAKRGSIAIYAPLFPGGPGHIAVTVGPSTSASHTIFQQNAPYPGVSPANVARRHYGRCLGFLEIRK